MELMKNCDCIMQKQIKALDNQFGGEVFESPQKHNLPHHKINNSLKWNGIKDSCI